MFEPILRRNLCEEEMFSSIQCGGAKHRSSAICCRCLIALSSRLGYDPGHHDCFFALCQYHHDFITPLILRCTTAFSVDATVCDRTDDIKMPRPRTASTASNGSVQARDQVLGPLR